MDTATAAIDSLLTVAPSTRRDHTLLILSTDRPTEFLDITDQLSAFVRASGVDTGILNVQSLHTTTGLVVNEHEPLLLADFESTLHLVAPREWPYRHDDPARRTVNLVEGERANGHAHCRALVLGAAVSLNVVGGMLVLGRWQRVFFVELDGPRPRQVSVLMLSTGVQDPRR